MSKVDGWTEGRYNSFITSVLRGGMRRWPNKWIALKEAYVGKQKGVSGRMVAHYRCSACNEHFTSTMVQVDHRCPVIDPATGFISWDDYIDKLFCGVDNLQILCKECHKQKTVQEKGKRSLKKAPSTPTKTPKMKSSTSVLTSSKPSSRKKGGVAECGATLMKKKKSGSRET